MSADLAARLIEAHAGALPRWYALPSHDQDTWPGGYSAWIVTEVLLPAIEQENP